MIAILASQNNAASMFKIRDFEFSDFIQLLENTAMVAPQLPRSGYISYHLGLATDSVVRRLPKVVTKLPKVQGSQGVLIFLFAKPLQQEPLPEGGHGGPSIILPDDSSRPSANNSPFALP